MGLPLALGAIGAGISAIGTVESGVAQSNAANYQAEVSRNNAKIAEQNATYAANAGEANAATASLKGAAQQANLKAAISANGVDVNTGSAANVLATERETNNLNTQNVLNQALLQAYGYKTQETGYTAESQLQQGEADQAPIGADIGAVGTLASNASSLGLKFGAKSGSVYSGSDNPNNMTAP